MGWWQQRGQTGVGRCRVECWVVWEPGPEGRGRPQEPGQSKSGRYGPAGGWSGPGRSLGGHRRGLGPRGRLAGQCGLGTERPAPPPRAVRVCVDLGRQQGARTAYRDTKLGGGHLQSAPLPSTCQPACNREGAGERLV